MAYNSSMCGMFKQGGDRVFFRHDSFGKFPVKIDLLDD